MTRSKRPSPFTSVTTGRAFGPNVRLVAPFPANGEVKSSSNVSSTTAPVAGSNGWRFASSVSESAYAMGPSTALSGMSGFVPFAISSAKVNPSPSVSLAAGR